MGIRIPSSVSSFFLSSVTYFFCVASSGQGAPRSTQRDMIAISFSVRRSFSLEAFQPAEKEKKRKKPRENFRLIKYFHLQENTRSFHSIACTSKLPLESPGIKTRSEVSPPRSINSRLVKSRSPFIFLSIRYDKRNTCFLINCVPLMKKFFSKGLIR